MASPLGVAINRTPRSGVGVTPPCFRQGTPWPGARPSRSLGCHGYDAARTGAHRGTSGRLVRPPPEDRCVRLAAAGRPGGGGRGAGRRPPRHKKTAVFGWLLLVVAAVVIGQRLGTSNINSYDPGQAGRAERVLD